MKRVMLTVAYDGTQYCGWQIQPGQHTIEEQLNKCLSELIGENIIVSGASRTDSGVHAMCNLAVFDTNSRIPGEKFSYALNQRLPEDIRIQKSQEVDLSFHPRKTETRKTYAYHIYNAAFQNPVYDRYSYFTYVNLDVEKMKQAAEYLVGEHDFASFSTYKPEVESTVRTIEGICIETNADHLPMGREIIIRITGNGFLYNMVRIIAGTLLEVGRGRMQPEDIPEILEKKDRQAAGPTAPACGLILENYSFEDAEYSIF